MTLAESLQLEVKKPKQLAAKSGSTKAKTLHLPTDAILKVSGRRDTGLYVLIRRTCPEESTTYCTQQCPHYGLCA